MAKKKPESPILLSLRRASKDKSAAVAFLERNRWGSEPSCPLCGSIEVYKMQGRDGRREQHFRWRCRDCEKLYSVRTGTVLEETRLPLSIWIHAFWRVCASKKGVSALQISRECSITHKSALFLLHRIRRAMDTGWDAPKLTGTVEADETYVGGKPRYRRPYKDKNKTARQKDKRRKHATGRRTKKTPVFAVVQRGGEVRTSVMTTVNKDNIAENLARFVDQSARLMTDEEPSYIRPGRLFRGGHETVNHRRREYARGDVSTNTIEGFFSILKRGLYGTFHSVSKAHLHRYLAEFEFRYNRRFIDDGERTLAAIAGAEGKRLMYRQPAPA